ncbi:MAG: hypothetical protein A2Z20_06855 [Bdellovibrionales bacterium RBG_16_40_8]|nr:MAG: hypothetical protein A2Z20_06855 [Bdellovibrionales bacterium RBG_16_40_8]
MNAELLSMDKVLSLVFALIAMSSFIITTFLYIRHTIRNGKKPQEEAVSPYKGRFFVRILPEDGQ